MTNNVNNTAVAQAQPSAPTSAQPAKLLTEMAKQYGVDWKALYNTLATTCFRKPDGSAPTKEEMMTLLVIANRVGLNPMLGELYAFPGKGGGIVPIVGINGWRQIATANPEFSGLRFEFSSEKVEISKVRAPEYVKCIVTRRRKDGTFFEVEGYAFFEEKFRSNSAPWREQPRQMLMNKAQIQALKNAFPSLSSLYDEDEGRAASAPSGIFSKPATPAPVQAMSRDELVKKLKKLVEMVRTRGQWAFATKWVMEHVLDDADQEFALEYIASARQEATTPTVVEDVNETNASESKESETPKIEDAPF